MALIPAIVGCDDLLHAFWLRRTSLLRWSCSKTGDDIQVRANVHDVSAGIDSNTQRDDEGSKTTNARLEEDELIQCIRLDTENVGMKSLKCLNDGQIVDCDCDYKCESPRSEEQQMGLEEGNEQLDPSAYPWETAVSSVCHKCPSPGQADCRDHFSPQRQFGCEHLDETEHLRYRTCWLPEGETFAPAGLKSSKLDISGVNEEDIEVEHFVAEKSCNDLGADEDWAHQHAASREPGADGSAAWHNTREMRDVARDYNFTNSSSSPVSENFHRIDESGQQVTSGYFGSKSILGSWLFPLCCFLVFEARPLLW